MSASLDAPVLRGDELDWVDGPTHVRPRASWVMRPPARVIADATAVAIAATAVSAAGLAGAVSVAPSTFAIATLATLACAGQYLPRQRPRMLADLRGVFAVSAICAIFVAGAGIALTGGSGIGDVAVMWWLVAAGVLGVGRLTLHTAWHFSVRYANAASRTLIVGAGRIGRTTAARLADDPGLGLRPVGYLDKEPMDDVDDPHRGRSLPTLGASWDLERVIEDHGIQTVIVAFSTAPHEVLVDVVRRSWAANVDVMIVPRLYEVEGRRMDIEHIGGLPLVGLRTTDLRDWRLEVKYLIDRVFAGVAIAALAPVLAVIWLLVRATMGGPVLFRQRRVGRDGVVFEMLKFRTMAGSPAVGESDAHWASLILNGSAEGEPMAEPDRRTPIGRLLRKLSLDELPQLWNVVRGDMSLIGPRPERVQYVEQFSEAVYRYPDRHRMKSGLTGWAQVHGLRGETSLEDRVEWDNFYIENWSPWLDVQILFRTLPTLLGHRGGQ